MERETQQVTLTKSGLVVTLKSWLTAREKRNIVSTFTKDSKYTVEAGFDISSSNISNYQDACIAEIIVSIGEVKDDLVNFALDNLHQEDFDQLINAINEIVNVSSEESKKK